MISEKDYNSLQDRFQALWFENHSLKEIIVQLEDKVETLEGIIEYEQDFK